MPDRDVDEHGKRRRVAMPFGAIDRRSGMHVTPHFAERAREYVCPDCFQELIFCAGEIVCPYFRHKADTSACTYYSPRPSESQIHRESKNVLKAILESDKRSLRFTRGCRCCRVEQVFEIPEFSAETSEVRLEYRFDHCGTKIADVAFLDDGDIVALFEARHTHATAETARPSDVPWFEFDATRFVATAASTATATDNDESIVAMSVPCTRDVICDDCTRKADFAHVKDRDLELYVRLKLGQTEFGPLLPPDANGYGVKHKHLRFIGEEDSCDIATNKRIMDLFDADFGGLKLVLRRHDYGQMEVFAVHPAVFDSVNCWDNKYFSPCQRHFQNEQVLETDCFGTVETIMDSIRFCQAKSAMRRSRLAPLKVEIARVKAYFDERARTYGDDTADLHRSMRDSDQRRRHCNCLEGKQMLIRNYVAYGEMGSEFVVLTNPVTKQTIKYSLPSGKVYSYAEKKWLRVRSVPISAMVQWYYGFTEDACAKIIERHRIRIW